MNTSIYKLLSQSLGFTEKQIEKTIELLDSGATIPFISRYRKEATGGLDEVQIGDIQTRYEKLCELSKRKETVLSTIEEQGKLTPELKARISACWNATELEDIYLPFKPKRKTRAEAARAKGLEPLAMIMMLQREPNLTAKAATLLAILLPLSLELIRMFPILPVLVVFLTLFRIAKHLVRLIDLLKLTMGVGIVRIQVRVILPSQLLIGFLDIILRSVLVHPQNLVIIDIGHNLICLVYFSHIII